MTMLLFLAAAAAAPEMRADFECMTLFSIGAAAGKTEAERNGAVAGTMYFYGRIDKGAPGIDLAAELTAVANGFEKMTPAQLETIGKRCDAELQAVGSRLQSVGKTMTGN